MRHRRALYALSLLCLLSLPASGQDSNLALLSNGLVYDFFDAIK